MKFTTFFVFSLIITKMAFSQTGPGGVGSSDGTSSLEYWMEASSAVTGSSPVTSWADLSGNTVTNTVLGDPVLTTNSLNSYSVITFDGTGDYISSNLDISGSTHPQLDVYAVYRFTGTSGAIWGEDNGSWDRFLVDANGAGGCSFGVGNGMGCSNNAALFPASTPVISSVQFSEDVINGSSAIVNGSQVLTFSSNHEIETSNNLELASIGNSIFLLTGDIAEVFVFSQNLNLAQQIILHNYLSAKYDIALLSNDIYNEDDAGNGDYDHDVAGIGRVDALNIHNDAQGTGIIRILNPAGLGNDEFLMWGHDNGIQHGIEISDVPASVDARLDRVWRVSEVNSSGTAVDVGGIDIRWDLTDLGAVTVSDLRLLVDTDNDGFFNDETPISGAASLGSNVYEFAGVTAITDGLRFTLGTMNDTQTPLPIELLNFHVQIISNNHVEVAWQTASEINNDFFELERSLNGTDWNVIEKIDGAGNSDSLLNYISYDESPFSGVSYYRLKQTDFDGQFSYSSVERINIERLINTPVIIYPHPADNQITIEDDNIEFEHIKIYNALGQDVTAFISIEESYENKMVIDLSELETGMFYIKAKTVTGRIYKQ